MSDQLESYERMHKDMKALYKEAEKEMERLKMEGKTKTISFREAMGRKGFYAKLLSIYAQYGIEEV